LRLIAEALRHVAQTGIVYYEAELHRLDAELRLRLDTPDEQRAEVSFRRALETAGRQQAKSWELRAATSLARLRGEGGGKPRRGSCSHPSTAGSPKGLTRAI
jgi:predicted ATPase